MKIVTEIDHYYAEDFHAARTKGVVRAKTHNGEVKLICLTATRTAANEIAVVLNHALQSLKQAENFIVADKAGRRAA